MLSPYCNCIIAQKKCAVNRYKIFAHNVKLYAHDCCTFNTVNAQFVCTFSHVFAQSRIHKRKTGRNFNKESTCSVI